MEWETVERKVDERVGKKVEWLGSQKVKMIAVWWGNYEVDLKVLRSVDLKDVVMDVMMVLMRVEMKVA